MNRGEGVATGCLSSKEVGQRCPSPAPPAPPIQGPVDGSAAGPKVVRLKLNAEFLDGLNAEFLDGPHIGAILFSCFFIQFGEGPNRLMVWIGSRLPGSPRVVDVFESNVSAFNQGQNGVKPV